MEANNIRKLPTHLQKLVNEAITLLRKAEKLALRYDHQNGFFLAFSGGKDSIVLHAIAELAGVKFKAHMSLTSIDPPPVIRFVKQFYPNCELMKPKVSIFKRAIEKNCLPSRRIRWCCAEFKETAGAGTVTLIGIRAAESARCAKRKEVSLRSRKFNGTFRDFEQYQHKVNEDEFSITSQNEVRCINGKDSILISPLLHFSDNDIWTFIRTMGLPHCELYDQGFPRIGCLCCPMSGLKQKRKEIERFPHIRKNWLRVIRSIREKKPDFNESFFAKIHPHIKADSPEQLALHEDEAFFEWWLVQDKQSDFITRFIYDQYQTKLFQ